MLRSEREIRGYIIRAEDGDIGKARGFLFDSAMWVVRYMIVDTGNWLQEREVLLSPECLGQPDRKSHRLSVELTSEQVRTSPDIDFEKPVSRDEEKKLFEHYGWVPYWMTVEEALVEEEGDSKGVLGRLRDTREICGYKVHAKDKESGHVDDFILDTDDWVVRYLVVDISSWLPGGRRLVAPQWTEVISWAKQEVYLDMDTAELKEALDYNPSKPVNRELEVNLYDFHGRRKYWE